MIRTADVVDARFEVLAVAGAGAMGTVYRALDRQTGATVALKQLGGAAAWNAERFKREVAVLAELSHPGIVRYVAHGALPDGGLYLAMEWLHGYDLAARLARQPLAYTEALALVRNTAEALGYAHARGVVHRDIKPSNLFLRDGDVGRVTVLDFGLARSKQGGGPHGGMTRTGVAMGTPGYMAPEQARGERDVDARADVFSLGCVLFECLTGRAPFQGDHVMALLAKILLEEAPAMFDLRPDVPRPLSALVSRMLAKGRDARPADGSAVAADLAVLATLAPDARAVVPGPAAVTLNELRTLSVLVAELPPAPASDDPLAPPDDGPMWDAIERLVAQHHARAELLASGALVVTVPASGAMTDRAARVARCALALRESLPAAPMAVATGWGAADVALPVGDVVDRAAALLAAMATAGGGAGAVVRLDAATARLLESRFEIRPDAGGAVLLRERAGLDVPRGLLGASVPCVGRERELALLVGNYEACAADAVARSVLVVAPPGAGKSRLRHEFVQRVCARPDAPMLLTARGDLAGAGRPYGALAQAFAGAAGLADVARGIAAREAARAYVARWVPPAERARVGEFLGELWGVPWDDAPSAALRAARLDAGLMAEQLREACLDVLRSACDAGPVLVVLEDLHACDLATVRVVDAALGALADRALMVLGVARPEVQAAFPRLWAERSVHQSNLGGVSRRAGEQLARAVLGSSADVTQVARIVEHAGGNAFCLEELLRGARDGADGVADDPWADAPVPATALALAQARLEEIPPELRRVARAASVLGPVFSRDGVAALLGTESTPARVADALNDLVARDVALRQDERHADDARFAFAHPLLREAAYAALPARDRRAAHRAAAAWLAAEAEAGADAAALALHRRCGDPRA